MLLTSERGEEQRIQTLKETKGGLGRKDKQAISLLKSATVIMRGEREYAH